MSNPIRFTPLIRTWLAWGIVGFAVGRAAAASIDLDRIDPVPATEPIPIQDFFRPVLLHDVSVNATGTYLAALMSNGSDKYKLLVQNLTTHKGEAIDAFGDKDFYDVNWLDDRHLMFGLSTEKLYGLAMMTATVGQLYNTFPLFQYCGYDLVSIPHADPMHPRIWLRNQITDGGILKDGGVVVANVYRPSLVGVADLDGAGFDWGLWEKVNENNDTHINRRYTKPPRGMGVGYLADKEGELAFGFTQTDGLVTMYRRSDDDWIPVSVDLDRLVVEAPGDHPDEVIVQAARQAGSPRALQVMDTTSGRLGAVLLQDKAYEFDGWLYRDPATRNIVGAVYDRAGPVAVWFDPAYQQLQKMLDARFPGKIVRILGSDVHTNVIVVLTYSDRQPPVYYIVDLNHNTMDQIARSQPWIDPRRMRPMQIMKYRTREGIALDAYLTLPAGASKAQPAPLVVLAHGGPFVRDTWGFDDEAQFLASRGYAVLQPNYRGSSGYDWKFPDDDLWNFPKMSEDVTAATRTVLRTGLIDPTRIAIMGGSFGGYLAISGVAHQPALYRCAITIAGVFDWRQMINDAKYDQYEFPQYAWLKRRLGDPQRDRKSLDAMSPIHAVNQIRVPVLVAAGKEDYTVDVGQSKALIAELNKYSVPHEDVIVAGEGHGMQHLGNQVMLYEKIEKFLAKNLAPLGAPPPAAAAP